MFNAIASKAVTRTNSRLVPSRQLFMLAKELKVDRLQIILVAKNIYIYVLQLFIRREPTLLSTYVNTIIGDYW